MSQNQLYINEISFEEAEIIKNLFKPRKQRLNSNIERYHPSALHYACYHKRLDLVKQLIASGSNVDHRDINGSTCLHYSASKFDINTIDYLLKNTSIDPKIINKDGRTALLNFIERCGFPGFKETAFQHLVDKTIQVDPETLNYRFEEVFEIVSFTCSHCWSSTMAAYIIKTFYSKNNLKYELISSLESLSSEEMADANQFYYFYAFCHDQITRQHIEKTDYWNYSLSYYFRVILEKSVESDDVNSTILDLFFWLDSIGFFEVMDEKDSYLKRGTSGDIGKYVLPKVSKDLNTKSHCKRLHNIINFLSQKGFDINLMLENYLSVILRGFKHYKRMFKIIPILLPFTTDFFQIIFEYHNRGLIPMYMFVPEIVEYFTDLLQNYGNTTDLGRIHGYNLEVFSLKHICRDHIRRNFLENSSYCEFFEKMDQLNSELPKDLISYLKFRD